MDGMRFFALTRRSIGWIVAIAVGLAVVYTVRPAYILGVAFGLWQPWNRPNGVSRAARYVSWSRMAHGSIAGSMSAEMSMFAERGTIPDGFWPTAISAWSAKGALPPNLSFVLQG